MAKAPSGSKKRGSKRAVSPRISARASDGVSAPAEFDLADILGQAGWVEADRALAEALRDLAALERAVASLAKTASKARLARTHDAMLLMRQSLMIAGRKRNLKPYGEIGASEPFNPRRHDIVSAARKPARVVIASPGVVRGGEVLVKALVKPTRPRKAVR